MNFLKKYYENTSTFQCVECNREFTLTFWEWLITTMKVDFVGCRFVKCPRCGVRYWLQPIRKELMDMFTARKAREFSDATSPLIIKRMVRKITKLVKRASKNGEYAIGYETSYSYPIRERVSQELRKLGYDTHIEHFNTIIKVFWGKEY